MIDEIFCHTCKQLLLMFGSETASLFESICKAYVLLRRPVTIWRDENDSFFDDIRKLEKCGCLISHENSLETLKIKPFIELNADAHICRFCSLAKVEPTYDRDIV